MASSDNVLLPTLGLVEGWLDIESTRWRESSATGRPLDADQFSRSLTGASMNNCANDIPTLFIISNHPTGRYTLRHQWTGIKLIDEEPNKNEAEFQDTLHDSFFETYWEWKKIRGDKTWKLDTHEE